MDGESSLKVVQSGLRPELLLRRRVDTPEQKMTETGDTQQNGKISGQKLRLVVSTLPAPAAVDGNRDQGVRFPAQDIVAVLPEELPGEELREHPPVFIFEGGHGGAGLLIIDKERCAEPEAFWENTAVVAVFLLSRQYRFAAGTTDWPADIRKLRAAAGANLCAIGQQDAADRAMPWVQQRQDAVI